MPKITIILPLSRPWREQRMLEQLQNIDPGPSQIDYLVIVDSQDIKIDWDLPNLKVLYMDNNHPGEANRGARRQRICDIMNLARTNIKDDVDDIIIIEDDTELPDRWYQNLRYGVYERRYQDYPQNSIFGIPTGIVCGVQAGRWAGSMIGSWKTDNPRDPTTLETLPLPAIPEYSVPYKDTPQKTKDTIWEQKMSGWYGHAQPVDATGLYCVIVKAQLFRDTPFHHNYHGPDVNFGLDLRTKGHQNYTDWDLICGHSTPQKTIWPTPETGTVKFIRDDNSPGGWRQVETT